MIYVDLHLEVKFGFYQNALFDAKHVQKTGQSWEFNSIWQSN